MDLSTVRLVAPEIYAISATNKRIEGLRLNDVKWLIEQGRVARIVRRGSGTSGAIRCLYLLALPGELAHRTSPSTVIDIGAGVSNYWHRDLMGMLGKRL